MKRRIATLLALSLSATLLLGGCGAKENASNNEVNVEVNTNTGEEQEETLDTSEILVDSTVEEIAENEEESKAELSLADELKAKIAETGVQFTIGEKVYTLGSTEIDEMIEDGYVDASILNEDNFKELINKNNGLVSVVNESGETIATVQIDNEHCVRLIENWSNEISVGMLSDITVSDWEANFTYDYDDGEMRYTILEINGGTVTVHFEKNDEGNWQMSSVRM